MDWHGRSVVVWQAWTGEAWHVSARSGLVRQAWQVRDGRRMARISVARQVRLDKSAQVQARCGLAVSGLVRSGSAGKAGNNEFGQR